MPNLKEWADQFIGRRYKEKHEVKEGICVSWSMGNRKTGIWLRCLHDTDNTPFSVYKSLPLKHRKEAQCNLPST